LLAQRFDQVDKDNINGNHNVNRTRAIDLSPANFSIDLVTILTTRHSLYL
jgi:hypothetical protein